MKRLNVPIFGLGMALVLFSAVWAFVLAPLLVFSDEDYAVTLIYEDEGESRPNPSAPVIYSRFIEEHKTQLIGSDGPIKRLEMSTRVIDVISGKLQFEKTSQLRFHSSTLKLEGSEALAFFPHHLEQKDYLVKQFSYLPDSGVLFEFKGTEQIEGALAYRFDYAAAGLDWTDGYDYALEPETKIEARDWGSLWLQPTTGIVVKHTENWFVKIVGGKFDGLAIDVGHMRFSPDTIAKQVTVAQNDRRSHNLYELIIPATLLLSGLIILTISFRRGEET